MNPTNRLLVRDLLVGLGAVLMPATLLAGGGAFSPPLLAGMAVAAIAGGGAQFLAERGRYPARIDDLRERPVALAALGVVAGVALVPPPLLVDGLAKWYLAAFVGLGLGLAGHRVVFGLLLPAPDDALATIRDGN